MSAPGDHDEERRKRLTVALQERARLLQPKNDAIERALRRCPPREHAAVPAIPLAAELAANQRSEGAAAPVARASAPGPSASSTASAVSNTSSNAPSKTPSNTPSNTTTTTAAEASAPTVLSEAGDATASPATETATTDDGTVRLVALKPGRIVAGYRIEALIGKGGMGQVYRATQLSMNRAVAFKVLSPKLASNPRFRDRFLREARAAGRLHHPNLIGVHDVGEADGLMYFSMELVEGKSLKEVLAKSGKAAEGRALEICRQTLEALRYAHAEGIVHRDIKPDNLMLTKSGMVKVADLGLSRSDGGGAEDAYTTQAGAIMGTPHYMAPEQGRDAHSVDHRADLYAVGATLYHLVCGSVPFPGETPMEVVIKAASQPLRFPEPGPSPSLRVLISRLMAKKPEERPQSAAEALEFISRLRRHRVETDPEHHQDAATAISRARGRRLRRSIRRAMWIGFAILIATMIAVFLGAMAGYYQWRQLQSQVAMLADAHRYRDALASVDLYHTGANPFGGRHAEIQQLHDRLAKDWDTWAYPQATKVFDRFHELLRANHLMEAYAELKIDETLASPAVRRDQDDCQRQWEEAMIKADAKDAEGKSRLEWPQDLMDQLVAGFWKRFTFQPSAGMELRENVARFSGSGTGLSLNMLSAADDQRPAGEGLRRRPVGCYFNVHLTGLGPEAETDAWGLTLGAGRSLLATHQGLVLREPGKPDRMLAPSANGTAVFQVRHLGVGWELRAGEGKNADPEWMPLNTTNRNQLLIEWRLSGKDVAEVRTRPNLGGFKREALMPKDGAPK